MFADNDKRQKIFQQAKEGVDDIKAGKHGEALGSFVRLASKTPVGAAANETLDALSTADYPAGTYHYHVTNTDPYINGAGFFGTAGTISQ